MKEPTQESPAQLEEYRRRAEAALEAAAEKLLAPDRTGADRVEAHFDWLVPSSADEAITFILDIKRGNRRSSVLFPVDLARLEGADLEQLHDFLLR
jgi:hypothetical protein